MMSMVDILEFSYLGKADIENKLALVDNDGILDMVGRAPQGGHDGPNKARLALNLWIREITSNLLCKLCRFLLVILTQSIFLELYHRLIR